MARGAGAATAANGLYIHVVITQDFHQRRTSFGFNLMRVTGAICHIDNGHWGYHSELRKIDVGCDTAGTPLAGQRATLLVIF